MSAHPPAAARIIAAVQLPPPVNGLTWVSERVVERLRAATPELLVLSISASGAVNQSPWQRRGKRLLQVLSCYAALFKAAMHLKLNPQTLFYLTPSGGIGKLIELPLVLVAHMAGFRILLHHHSFAYINQPSVLSRLYFRLAGQHAKHICLGQTMADGMKARYGIHNYVIVSNAAFMDPPRPRPERPHTEHPGTQPVTLGFLGNIDFNKGILDFLDTIEHLNRANFPCWGLVAGPFANDKVRTEVLARARPLHNVQFIGAVYGQPKEDFFHSLDWLLFPSRYVNEAEPVTILEALSAGVPVIGSKIGGIPDIFADATALLLATDHFSESAAAIVRSSNYRADQRQLHAMQQFDKMQRLGREALKLLNQIW